jgi:hypothetical protein
MIEAPPRRDSTPEEVAYHEAGHAVVGNSLGLDLIDVDTLGDGENGHGHTRFRPPEWFRPGEPRGERHRRLAEAIVVTFLAGAAAEARHAGFRNPDASGFDLEAVASEWLQQLDSPDEEALRRRAEAIVETNWPAIERLAKALMHAHRLPGQEALAVAVDSNKLAPR